MSSSATEGALPGDALPGDAPPDGELPAEGVPSPRDPGDEAIPAAASAHRASANETGANETGRPKLSKLAVVALITGILPLVPVAVVTGIAALAGIRRSGRRGHGMAVGALFCAAGWIIIGGAFGTVAALTHGFQKPTKVIYHQSAVFSLRAGQCVDSPDTDSPALVPCAGPHDAEVYGAFTMPAAPWPGTAAVQQQAGSRCDALLTGYLNPQLAISLSQSYVYPNEVDWNAGTRTVICEVRATSGQLTQSVRSGSGS